MYRVIKMILAQYLKPTKGTFLPLELEPDNRQANKIEMIMEGHGIITSYKVEDVASLIMITAFNYKKDSSTSL